MTEFMSQSVAGISCAPVAQVLLHSREKTLASVNWLTHELWHHLVAFLLGFEGNNRKSNSGQKFGSSSVHETGSLAILYGFDTWSSNPTTHVNISNFIIVVQSYELREKYQSSLDRFSRATINKNHAMFIRIYHCTTFVIWNVLKWLSLSGFKRLI